MENYIDLSNTDGEIRILCHGVDFHKMSLLQKTRPDIFGNREYSNTTDQS